MCMCSVISCVVVESYAPKKRAKFHFYNACIK